MSKELQNDEFYLKGDLGTVKIGNAHHEVTKVFKANDGSTTVTLNPFPHAIELTFRKGWDLVTPKQIENGK